MNQEKNEVEELKEEITHHTLSAPTVKSEHNWKMQGGYLNCFSCESPHGFHIGVDKIYKGKDENGNLIIINREL